MSLILIAELLKSCLGGKDKKDSEGTKAKEVLLNGNDGYEQQREALSFKNGSPLSPDKMKPLTYEQIEGIRNGGPSMGGPIKNQIRDCSRGGVMEHLSQTQKEHFGLPVKQKLNILNPRASGRSLKGHKLENFIGDQMKICEAENKKNKAHNDSLGY